MAVLLASAYALSLIGLVLLGVLIKEIYDYPHSPPLFKRLAISVAVFGIMSVSLRVIAYMG